MLGKIGIFFAAVVVSMLLTGVCRIVLMRRAILDIPNARSSHDRPVVRGGGLAIIIVFFAVAAYLHAKGQLADKLVIAIVLGGLGVGVIGLVDDFKTVSAWRRLVMHCLAAVTAVAMIEPSLERVPESFEVLTRGCIFVFAVLTIVWHVNLFNFMDGIDGFAGSQAVFVSIGASYICWSPDAAGVSLLLLGLGGATLGFLVWNWPPAKIFMGDAGSGFLGFTLAVFGLYCAVNGIMSIWVWAILSSAFLADATVTLLRRLIRQEKVYQAHRCHAYQHIALLLNSHKKVTQSLWLVNLVWLFPFALAADFHQEHGMLIATAAMLPLIGGVAAAGAGVRKSD